MRPNETRRRDASRVARSGAAQILAAIGQGLLPLHQILLARLFGAHIQGLYGTAVAYLDVLGRAAVAGSDKGLLCHVAAHRAEGSDERVAQALAAALRLSLTAALVMGLALVVVAGGIGARSTDPALATALRTMSPAVLAYALVLVLVAATLGARTSRVHLLVRGIAEPALLMVGALAAWTFHAGLPGLAFVHVLVMAAAGALAVLGAGRVLGWPVLRQALLGPSLPGFKRFAVPLGISDVTTAVLQRADVIILAAFVDAPTVGFYIAAEQLSRSVAGVRHAFDGVAGPLLSESLHLDDHGRLGRDLKLLTRWVALAAAPIAAVAYTLRPELLSLFGPQHHRAAGAMALLLLAQLVTALVGLTSVVLIMSGRSRLFMGTSLAAAALNLLLNLALVPRLGLMGAAIASAASVLALQFSLAAATWVAHRVHPLSWDLAKVLVAGGVAWAVAAALKGTLRLPPMALVGAVVAGAVVAHVGALLVLGLPREDRALIGRAWRKLRGRGAPQGR